MDPAIIGTMRIDYFRIGVIKPIYDQSLQTLEHTAKGYEGREGYEREGVIIRIFDDAIKVLEKV